MTLSNPQRRAFLQARWSEASAPSSSAFLTIGSACLARHSIACDLCRDACELSVIRFAPRSPVALPSVNTELCTACGECISVCPVGALALHFSKADRV
jgi:ferredoxin-type protein NapF